MQKRFFALLFFLKLVVFVGAQPPKFSLDELEKRTFNYFWKTADAQFQTPDRYPTPSFSSIAATGFGLSSYLVGVERGYISRAAAAERVLSCLTALKNLPQGDATAGVAGFRGFFYHFLTSDKATRFKDVELSTIDTGLLMAGILSCETYFDQQNEVENAIRRTADFLYRRVEWDWMLNSNFRLSMGWKPERGFLNAEWAGYNEAMILYLLALGSPSHPIDEKAWAAWCSTYFWNEFEGQPHLNFGPLFGHQYSQTWVDFRGIRDEFMAEKGIDYFENSRRATLANRAACLKKQADFPHFSEKIWGLTACDGPADWLSKNDPLRRCNEFWEKYAGYNARGAASDYDENDGTIAPTAAGGSVAFEPEVCLPALEAMWTNFGDSLVGEFGFKDAFNPSFTACGRLPRGWFDVDYLGIDEGPILLMLENHRSQFLWNLMKRNPHLVRGLKRAGFEGGWLDDTPESIIFPSKNPNSEVPLDPKWLFSREIFHGKKGFALPFRLLSPQEEALEKGEKFPLVIFLHGSGERGTDNETPLKNAVLSLVEPENLKKYPCFLLVPQCPEGENWGGVSRDWEKVTFDEANPSPAGAALIELIEKMLAENPRLDSRRIYLAGLSMGGFGTYDLLMRRPDLFAAGVPICGGADARFASKIKDLPLWIFHGALDEAVLPKYDRPMVEALKKAGSQAKYTEFSTLGHACWEQVFYNPEVFEWLFSQRKK